jgi:hypothetical protein
MEGHVDHFVTLAILPENFQIPTAYTDRFRFDPATHRLVYRGFMSKVDFDRLCGLSDDWGYRRQLEELFRQCTLEDPSRPRGLRRFLSPLASLGMF